MLAHLFLTGLLVGMAIALACSVLYAFLIPDVGKTKDLDDTLAGSSSWQVCLYTNSGYTWSDSSILADLTEATFSGYARMNPSYPASSLVSHVATSVASSIGWTITAGSQTIYGYFILDGTGALRGGENFAAPVALNVSGGPTVLVLTQTQTSNHS